MATTLTVLSKTPTSISLSATKTYTNAMYMGIGPGTTVLDIMQNPVDTAVEGSGSTGTYTHTFSSGLSANTQYGAVAYGYGAGESEVSNIVDATLPPPALSSTSVDTISTTKATIRFTTAVDGGYYPKKVQYSLDNGATWINWGILSGGTAASGSIRLSGLTAETNYTIPLRTTTSAGSSPVTTVSFTTAEAPKKIKTYGSASGSARLLTDLYGSSNDQAQRLARLYGSSNSQAELIHQGFGHYDYGYGSVEYYTDSSHTTKTIGKLRSTSEVNSLAGSTSSWTATVDGQSVSNSDIISVELNSKVSTVPTYFLSGCTSLNNVDLYFANILNLGDYFLSECSNFNGTIALPYKLLNIGNRFLQGCSSFNQVLSFPKRVGSIGDYFLYNCSSYNKALVLPDSLVSIGSWFLYQCRLFNQNLSLPSSLVSIGTAFISMNISESGVGAMTGTIDVGNLPATIIASSNFSFACISSSAPMYTTGITISGSTRADWMTKFPNGNNSGLRRKLIDAGY